MSQDKSLLATAISEYADQKLLRIRDFESLATRLDSDFELITESGAPAIVRKATNQVVPGNFESNLQDLLRSSVDDRSFGRHRSTFSYTEPTPELKGQVKSIIDNERIVYKSEADRVELETFLLKNFIPDGSNLRPVHRQTGYTGDPRAAIEVITHYAADRINPLESELARLEYEAQLNEAANRLGNNVPSTVGRAKELLKKKFTPAFEVYPQSKLDAQVADMTKKAFAHLNILDTKAATLANTNAAGVKVNVWQAELKKLPDFTWSTKTGNV